MAADFDRDAIVRDHHVGVWRYLRFLGCDRATADDLTQETFLVFLRKPFDYNGRESTSQYLRRVARFIYLEAARKAARQSNEKLDKADRVFKKYAGRDGGDEYLNALRDCVKTLADKARTGIELQYKSRLSQAEIADRLGMKPNGVKTLLQRARQHLRECVERRLR